MNYHNKKRLSFSLSLSFIVLICSLYLTSCVKTAPTSYQQVLNIASSFRGKEVINRVLLPSRYFQEKEKRYPVLYLLHGAYGNSSDWLKRTSLFRLSRDFDLIIVLPDGDPFGWYLDSPLVDTSKIESYFFLQLIPAVDSCYRTIASRVGRGICGLSMGGHGALLLSLRHPKTFLTASSLSGVLNINSHRKQWHLSELIPADNDSLWQRYSVYRYSQLLIMKNAFPDIIIKFDVGIDDFTYQENHDYHLLLERHQIKHSFRVYPGKHSWDYWGTHIREHLEFHSRYLSEPLHVFIE